MFLKRNFLRFLAQNSKYLTSIRQSSQKNEFKLVYSFSYVRVGSLINTIKFRQVAVTALAMPLSAGLEYTALFAPGTTYACLMIGVALNATLFGVGQIFKRFVGKVYIDEKNDFAKLAYLGPSGQRLEIEVPIENIEVQPGFLYNSVKFHEEDLVLKLNEKYFDYCDLEQARKIFGEGFLRSPR